jgi:lamin tail-like protein
MHAIRMARRMRATCAVGTCLALSLHVLGFGRGVEPVGLADAQQLEAPQAATLTINEYLADPPPGALGDANGDGIRDATQDEFVELVNTGAVALNIGGFTISDATTVRFTVPAGRSIPPGEAAVVFGGGNPTGPFGNAGANGLVFVAGASGLSLNNGGDTITVKDALGAVVASVGYGSTEGGAHQSITRSPDVTGGFVTHSSATGSGGSLFSPGTRINGVPFTTSDPVISSISPAAVVAGADPVTLQVSGSNFVNGAHVRVDGTSVNTTFSSTGELSANIPVAVTTSPGSHSITVQNPSNAISNAVTLTVLSAIGINEFMADPPDGPAGDANGDGIRDSSQDEFIELINRSTEPLNIGGYSVRDSDGVRLTFPSGTVIPAGEVAVIFGGGSPRGDFGNAAANGLVFTAVISLNNTGDTITITNSSGVAVESVTYSSAEGSANQSINRNPESIGHFVPHSTVPGSAGRLFSPGTLVDGSTFSIGPRITRIDPDHALLSQQPFDVSIEGSGFEFSSIAFIDSLPALTQFVGSRLTARVPASVASTPGLHRVEVRNENGNRSNAVVLTIIPPPPTLSAVFPRVIAAGGPQFTLVAEGSGFDSHAVVLFDGSALTMTSRTARELRATVPAALTAAIASHRIVVRNGDGQQSGELIMDVIAPSVRVTSISPTDAVAGGSSFTLTLRGSSFKSGALILFDQIPLVTRVVSATELSGVVTPDLIERVGLRAVSAQNADGRPSNELIFRVTPDNPFIESIDPDRTVEGAEDLLVTITGSKFQPGAIVRLLNFQPEAQLEPHVDNAHQLSVVIPAAFIDKAGQIDLVVENPDTGVSNKVVVKVLIKDALVINEFLADPPEGLAGDANGDGVRSSSQDEFVEIVNRTSEPLDISGYKLSDGDQVRHVFAAGTIIPPFEATVVFGGGQPAGRFGNAAENHLVFRASSGGLSLNNTGDTIRLEDAARHIIQELKYGADAGGAGQSMNRDPDVDGPTFSPHTIISGGRLFSPGARANAQPFTSKPVVTSISPASIRVGASELLISIAGSDFVAGATVLFGEAQLAASFRSATLLEVLVPADLLTEAGSTQLRVRNPRGELSSSIKFIIVDDPPRMARITPDQIGTGAEHLEISIAGERFQRGANLVIGSEKIETSFVSKSELRATVPDHFFSAAAEFAITLLNADGNSSNALRLRVVNGPLITRLSRKRLRVGSGDVEIGLGGVAFKPDVIIFSGDTPLSTRFESETAIKVRIPGDLTSQPGELTLQARQSDWGRSNRVTVRVVE